MDNSAPVSGGSGFTRGGQTGATNASVGGGASRKADAQDIGNRRLGKIPIKVRYDYERYGLLFATEDDELTMKINLMLQADAKIYSPAGGDPTESGWYVPRSASTSRAGSPSRSPITSRSRTPTAAASRS